MALCEKGTSNDEGKTLCLITDSFVSAVSWGEFCFFNSLVISCNPFFLSLGCLILVDPALLSHLRISKFKLCARSLEFASADGSPLKAFFLASAFPESKLRLCVLPRAIQSERIVPLVLLSFDSDGKTSAVFLTSIEILYLLKYNFFICFLLYWPTFVASLLSGVYFINNRSFSSALVIFGVAALEIFLRKTTSFPSGVSPTTILSFTDVFRCFSFA